MLTEEQMRDALRQCPHDTVENLRVRWLYAKDFARAIESAACAERDARIAELEAANEAFGKRQEWWNARMLELEQQLEEARKAMELARSWIAEKPDLRQCSAGKVVSELTLALAIKEQT